MAELNNASEQELLREMSAGSWEQYLNGVRFKNSIGEKGLFVQSKMNERFFLGDQWHGANCGNDRPLVRYNVIKRIGEYKIAVVGGKEVEVKFSADGVPFTVKSAVQVEEAKSALVLAQLAGEEHSLEKDGTSSTQLALQGMSDYYKSTCERVDFEKIKEQILRNAYISGTGVAYTWWDNDVDTGLYADSDGEFPIKGDIACEVIDVENVFFGEPEIDDIQSQSYVMIAQKRRVRDVRNEARSFGLAEHAVSKIVPDSGVRIGEKQDDIMNAKVTVLTKFWKDIDFETGEVNVYAVKICNGTFIRTPWSLGIRLYPFVKFDWEKRRNLIYGNSEISYLIPNQIAINRMATANVWAVMMMGMPIMMVNGELIEGDITNDPGQVIQIYGDRDDINSAIKYVEPPSFSPEFNANIKSVIDNTLGLAGVNDALLGDLSPNNTSAILAVREAALVPLEHTERRFRGFYEDVARIWAEFWVTQYGNRKLKISDGLGTWYLPFDGDKYRHLVLSAKVQVSSAVSWSHKDSIEILNMLLDRGVIDKNQYLQRLPDGIVDNVEDLISDGNESDETAN